MDTTVEHPLPNVRGQADIDVYAVDRQTQPPTVYLCECKQWSSAVPQTVVHAFRQVVTDSGANWGLLIARNGFQSGAHQAADRSNVKLLTWSRFAELFSDRWVDNYLRPTLATVNEPLVDYTEPYSAKVIRHPMPFDDAKRAQFAALVDKYHDLAFFCLPLYLYGKQYPLSLPLRDSYPRLIGKLPAELMDETVLRQFLALLIAQIETGLREFDAFFGGRIQ